METPKCPSTNERVDKNTVFSYNGILFDKKNEVLMHATTLIMKLENIMLNERSRTQKATYSMTPFI